MKNKQLLLIIVLVLIVLICGASLLYGKLGDQAQQELEDLSGHNSASQSQKIEAPDFTVYDIDGNPVTLSDKLDKPVVLNFWSSRCGPCVAEMPVLEEAFTTLGHEVNFMMVNVTDNVYWDTLDSATAFMSQNSYSFPVYYDTDQQASPAYGTSSLPVTFFIDTDGYVTYYHIGQINLEKLIAGIKTTID